MATNPAAATRTNPETQDTSRFAATTRTGPTLPRRSSRRMTRGTLTISSSRSSSSSDLSSSSSDEEVAVNESPIVNRYVMMRPLVRHNSNSSEKNSSCRYQEFHPATWTQLNISCNNNNESNAMDDLIYEDDDKMDVEFEQMDVCETCHPHQIYENAAINVPFEKMDVCANLPTESDFNGNSSRLFNELWYDDHLDNHSSLNLGTEVEFQKRVVDIVASAERQNINFDLRLATPSSRFSEKFGEKMQNVKDITAAQRAWVSCHAGILFGDLSANNCVDELANIVKSIYNYICDLFCCVLDTTLCCCREGACRRCVYDVTGQNSVAASNSKSKVWYKMIELTKALSNPTSKLRRHLKRSHSSMQGDMNSNNNNNETEQKLEVENVEAQSELSEPATIVPSTSAKHQEVEVIAADSDVILTEDSLNNAVCCVPQPGAAGEQVTLADELKEIEEKAKAVPAEPVVSAGGEDILDEQLLNRQRLAYLTQIDRMKSTIGVTPARRPESPDTEDIFRKRVEEILESAQRQKVEWSHCYLKPLEETEQVEFYTICGGQPLEDKLATIDTLTGEQRTWLFANRSLLFGDKNMNNCIDGLVGAIKGFWGWLAGKIKGLKGGKKPPVAKGSDESGFSDEGSSNNSLLDGTQHNHHSWTPLGRLAATRDMVGRYVDHVATGFRRVRSANEEKFTSNLGTIVEESKKDPNSNKNNSLDDVEGAEAPSYEADSEPTIINEVTIQLEETTSETTFDRSHLGSSEEDTTDISGNQADISRNCNDSDSSDTETLVHDKTTADDSTNNPMEEASVCVNTLAELAAVKLEERTDKSANNDTRRPGSRIRFVRASKSDTFEKEYLVSSNFNNQNMINLLETASRRELRTLDNTISYRTRLARGLVKEMRARTVDSVSDVIDTVRTGLYNAVTNLDALNRKVRAYRSSDVCCEDDLFGSSPPFPQLDP